MKSMEQKVRIWEESREIPTYGVGEPEKNPMFLEKRVYQGSSGKVYPYPVIDKIHDNKTLQTYKLVILENEYIHIEVMPEIGGRIYRALDKTNNYDFVYYNRVIKPALVGLAGPWISGGIEFNWPQHHRPNTFGPVEYKTSENEDGSATVWVSEIDRMYGTKVTAGFTLYPGKAYLEINVQLYNRTAEPQTFLWWANPAVAVNDYTQSVFPPDVHAVFDHGKRDVSRFPIATGTYYKMDYSEGVDISRYKNIPVPTSYMAYKSDYNFVGGYDHGVQAGLLHVANHHISPGKKQWTWGNGDFGQAWDRNLTDEDGPYIELMTGVYTDNQPDFSWLQPYEEKTFTQYFMPYKNIGVVKNASINAAVNLEVDELSNEASICVYTTAVFEGATIELKGNGHYYLKETVNLSPVNTFQTVITLENEEQEHDLQVTVRDKKGTILISYQPEKNKIEEIPDAAKPLPLPEELKTTEELFLAGLHLEQYRHATFEPEAYYLEGLKRDSKDSRLNVAYGTLLLRRGLFAVSEKYFRTAISSLTWRNPNPYDSEAYYQLGVSLKLQGKLKEAFSAFYKSVWSSAWQDSGYFSLAQIAVVNRSLLEALELIEKSLNRNVRNFKGRHLKTAILRKLKRFNEAKDFAEETLRMDIADFGAYNELYLVLLELGKTEEAFVTLDELRKLMRDDVHNYLHLAADYESCGLYEEAIQVLNRLVPDEFSDVYPLLHYTMGYLYSKMNQFEKASVYRKAGNAASSDYCFPNSLFELIVLEDAICANPRDEKANYYLGNLYYDKKRYKEAIVLWEKSRKENPDFATVHRNLALAYYNQLQDYKRALASLKTAFACNKLDARVLYELDQLYKKLGYAPEKRFEHLHSNFHLVEARDDLYLEYVTLLNTLGQFRKSIEFLSNRIFHPWEGGEGKVTGQYVFAQIELGKQYLSEMNCEEAIQTLKKALVYPHNLGEGKLQGSQDNNIHYYLGCAYEGIGDFENSQAYFSLASQGLEEPASAMYYNDAPPDTIFYQGLSMLKLKNDKEAKRRFNKLIDYGENHLFDDPKIDYFAVSLPDFLVFEDDLKKRNEIHCRYMMALGLIGLNKYEQANAQLKMVLSLDPNHQGARVHQAYCPLK
ncbi:tetratricopeptide repeat protein [Neobacillus massiliamazoniensis]|uniref:Tetratricopeptide repeat protein n=2 Tax=Neobacillus massiliamazoniensis TaxID=1499688 RepID=A0A0U1NQF4_9BACI|nr:tetratricopeptide repeat protein [Neobacillus massiliamazoniensis]